MAKDAYVFDRESVLKLQRLVAAQQQAITNLQTRLHSLSVQRHQVSFKPSIVYVCKTVDAIDAMAGSVAGFGVVVVQRIDQDGTITATDRKFIAYNVSASEVAADTIVQVKEELATHRLVIDFENCGA